MKLGFLKQILDCIGEQFYSKKPRIATQTTFDSKSKIPWRWSLKFWNPFHESFFSVTSNYEYNMIGLNEWMNEWMNE